MVDSAVGDVEVDEEGVEIEGGDEGEEVVVEEVAEVEEAVDGKDVRTSRTECSNACSLPLSLQSNAVKKEPNVTRRKIEEIRQMKDEEHPQITHENPTRRYSANANPENVKPGESTYAEEGKKSESTLSRRPEQHANRKGCPEYVRPHIAASLQ